MAMDKLMRRAPIVLLTIVAGLTTARAAPPAAAYFAARDAAVAKIRALEAKKGAEAAAETERVKALADLETRLKALIGAHGVKGFPETGKIAFDSLSENDIGFSAVDGLRFARSDDGPQLVVTTDALLDRWLRTRGDWWKKTAKKAPGLDAAMKADGFYTQAIGVDAAFGKTADIPIEKPAGATAAVAMLGGWAQDVGPNPRQEIIVALRKGGKLYIASSAPATTQPIAACEALWAEGVARARKADDSLAREDKRDAAYRACFNERAPQEKFFPALIAQAREIARRIAGQ